MESNLGINDMDVKKATSPSTILEHIIDFITFGGVRKELTKQYNEFCSKIVDTLEQFQSSNNLEQYKIPKKLKFNFLGKNVTFSNEDDHVSINVHVQGKGAKKIISKKLFNNFCTIQLLMKREGLSKNQAWLTNDGNICLSNADLSNRDLLGIDLRNAELNNVDLSKSDLSFSNLKGAKLQFINLDSVCYAKQTERNTCIRNICDYLKTIYQKDGEGNRNPKSDGLFRLSTDIMDLKIASKAFNEGKINVEDYSVHSLRKILLAECIRLNPISDMISEGIEIEDGEFLSIFNKKVQSMIPEERKEFEMILNLYGDAYDSADDDTCSTFNKVSILNGSVIYSLFNNYPITDTSNQKGMKEIVNKQLEISKEIITSLKQRYVASAA
jgi:hypothetical protein